ncbi:DUF2179 domain-containing protein [bacterium]|nr:DUF2179 domain-containing protein [bacterium]RQV95518.1 MAG: DUF2179 domain-containing protein [bacterium]
MEIETFLNSEIFTFVILPLLIFIARICDVTLGTIRIMFVSRGNKLLAPILGFFEIVIWLIAIRQIMQNLNNIFCYLAYAGGFSIGNYLGIKIEEKVAYGKVIIRMITTGDTSELADKMRARGFGVTQIDAEGSSGKVNILYSIVDRVYIDKAIRTIDRYNPKAFFTIEDVLSAREGIFPTSKSIIKRLFRKPPKFYRRIRIYRRMYAQRKSK